MEKKRYVYLDVMRGLAVFFMIMQHAMIMYERTAGEGEGILSIIFMLLGTAPAAPVFLLITGVFLAKTENSVKSGILRGAKLFVFGFILNFCRFVIPILIARVCSRDITMIMMKDAAIIDEFFTIDIFQVAGLSIIICTLLRRFCRNKFVLPALMLIVVLVSPYLWGAFDNNRMIWAFFGVGKTIMFPLFPWIVYPMLGMYLSKYLAKVKIEKKHRKMLIIWAAIILIVGALSAVTVYPIGTYANQYMPMAFGIISFVLLYVVFIHYITHKTIKDEPSRVHKLLIYWSRNVTNIYIIQWIIFGYSVLLLNVNIYPDYIALIFGVIVCIAAHYISKNDRIRNMIPKM